MDGSPAQHLARNVRLLREARGLTQEQLSRLSGVPRATWANLESGTANPTLGALLKVASALQVTVEELVSPPRATGRHHPSSSLPVKNRSGVQVRTVLPEATPGLQFERLEMPPGAVLRGTPHTPGTREYLTCESGEVELTATGHTFRLEPGDVVVFRGDQNHSYRNPGTTLAVAYSVVAIAPGATSG